MKKIVALVLVLALALSLATVAFAVTEADSTGKTSYEVFLKNGDEGYNKAAGFKVKFVAAGYDDDAEYGWLDHYVADNGEYVVVTKDAECAIQVDGKTVLLKKAVVFSDVDYNFAGTEVAKDYVWDCETGVHDKGVLDADGNLWTKNENGTTYALVNGKIVAVVPYVGGAYKGSHVLTYVGETANKQVNEYKCVVCGKSFYGTKDIAVANAATLKHNYYAITTEWLTGARGYVTIPEFTKVVFDNLYIWAVDGSAASTGVSSAKTFDAGVALYAGMALMSVAGSAVVIGKKKEF